MATFLTLAMDAAPIDHPVRATPYGERGRAEISHTAHLLNVAGYLTDQAELALGAIDGDEDDPEDE